MIENIPDKWDRWSRTPAEMKEIIEKEKLRSIIEEIERFFNFGDLDNRGD